MSKEDDQKLFDRSVGGILKQGKRSCSYDMPCCRYRFLTMEGELLRCAVGQLIDDVHYEQTMEGMLCAHIFEKVKLSNDVEEVNEPMLFELQEAHDKSKHPLFFIESFKFKAKQIADRFFLEWKF
jgi:hypothetical protein